VSAASSDRTRSPSVGLTRASTIDAEHSRIRKALDKTGIRARIRIEIRLSTRPHGSPRK